MALPGLPLYRTRRGRLRRRQQSLQGQATGHSHGKGCRHRKSPRCCYKGWQCRLLGRDAGIASCQGVATRGDNAGCRHCELPRCCYKGWQRWRDLHALAALLDAALAALLHHALRRDAQAPGLPHHKVRIQHECVRRRVAVCLHVSRALSQLSDW